MRQLYLSGMFGLGDNLYQRAILTGPLRDAEVWLKTPWPQLYHDLPNVHPVSHPTVLRTQSKNMARGFAWEVPPLTLPVTTWRYDGNPAISMVEALQRCLGLTPTPLHMSAPEFPLFPDERYIVVRPATIRSEWSAESRNPRPEYIAQAADAARARGYRVISVADLQPGAEWALDPLPYADTRYHSGELTLPELMGLIRGASGCIGGVGWMLPAAMAYKVPVLQIYGGTGGHNHPGRLVGPYLEGEDRTITHVVPDRFCRCVASRHACDKFIGGFDDTLDAWLNRL